MASSLRIPFQVKDLWPARLSELVGREISVESLRSVGCDVYTATVLESNGRRLRITLPRGSRGGFLRRSQVLTVRFVVGGSWFEAHGKMYFDGGRSCLIEIVGEVIPAARRRFPRYQAQLPLGMAPVSDVSLRRRSLRKLTWRWLHTCDVSAGGVQLPSPADVPAETLFLLNPDWQDAGEFPFMFGTRRWTRKIEGTGTYRLGLAFLTRDCLARYFSPQTVAGLPSGLLQFDRERQQRLAATLAKTIRDLNRGE